MNLIHHYVGQLSLSISISPAKLHESFLEIKRREPARRTTLNIAEDLEEKIAKAASLFCRSEKDLIGFCISTLRNEIESNLQLKTVAGQLVTTGITLTRRKTRYLSYRAHDDLKEIASLLDITRSSACWIACNVVLVSLSHGCEVWLEELRSAERILSLLTKTEGYSEITSWKRKFSWIYWSAYAGVPNPGVLPSLISDLSASIKREMQNEEKLIRLLAQGKG